MTRVSPRVWKKPLRGFAAPLERLFRHRRHREEVQVVEEVQEVLLPSEDAPGGAEDVRRTQCAFPGPMSHEDLLPLEDGEHARDQQHPAPASRHDPPQALELDPVPGAGALRNRSPRGLYLFHGLGADDRPAVAVAVVDGDVLEPGPRDQARGLVPRVVLRVGGIELVVDGQAALRGIETTHDLAHVAAEREGQHPAEADVGDERQVDDADEGGQQRMRQPPRHRAQRCQEGEVEAVPLAAVEPDPQAAARTQGGVGRAHDRIRIGNVVEHSDREDEIDVRARRHRIAREPQERDAIGMRLEVLTKNVERGRRLDGRDVRDARRQQHGRDAPGAAADLEDAPPGQIFG
jgi:hypothetical protein